MVVRELVTRLGFNVDNNKLKGYERSIGNIKTQADSAANAFRGMFAAFVGFQGLKSLANTADNMQNLEARVSQLPQTVGDSADAVNELAKRANASRQPLLEYAQLYTRIGNASKDYLKTQDDVLTVTDAVSKGLIVGGASAQESASVMLQLSQALGSGVLQGQEFNAMAEGSPKMLDMLAVAMGYPRDQLKKLASEGKITTKILIEAFQKIAPEINKQFKQMPQTIGQTTTIMANRWMEFIGKLNRDSGAVKVITDMMTKGWDKADNALQSLVDTLGGATNTVKFFGIALAAIAIPLGFKLLVNLVATLLSPMGLLLAGLLLVGLTIEDVYQYMNGGVSVTAKFIDWLKEGSFGASILVSVVTVLTAAFVSWGIATTAAFVKAGIAAAVFFTNAAIGLLTALAPFLLIIAAIVAVVAAIYYLWTNWKQIFNFISDIALKTWTGITGGFYEMVNKLKSYWNDFKSLFSIGVSTSITAGKVAGAASSPSGVGGFSGNNPLNVTVNQTLPPGTTAETKEAAKNATIQALQWDNSAVARQMGQAQ